ncbi:MAG TPA: hypothetical protein VKG44_04230 [Candidatus Baltobacteraceae bacterium]|nr:hypothetical protein [Candidatus Baltobacteraceae bacterium]
MAPIPFAPARAAASSSPAPERIVAREFSALLFAQALKPLAVSLGWYGDVVVASAARSAAHSERDGLSALIEREVRAAER